MSKLGTENFPLIDQEGRRFTLLYPLESEIPDFAREIARSANGRAAEADDRTLAVRLYRDALGSDTDAGALIARYGRKDNAVALAREGAMLTPVDVSARFLSTSRRLQKEMADVRPSGQATHATAKDAIDAAVSSGFAGLSSYVSAAVASRAGELHELVSKGGAQLSEVVAGYGFAAGYGALAATGAVIAAPKIKRSLAHFFQKSSDIHAGRPMLARHPFGISVDPERKEVALLRLRELSAQSTPDDFLALAAVTEGRLRMNIAREMKDILPQLKLGARHATGYEVIDIRGVAEERGIKPAVDSDEIGLITGVQLLGQLAEERGVEVPPLDVRRAHREGLGIVADAEYFAAVESSSFGGFTFASDARSTDKAAIIAFAAWFAPAREAAMPARDRLRMMQLADELDESSGLSR